MQPDEVDITGVSIRLNELKSRLDRIIREGETFENIKETYFQIKELECHQNAMQWDPDQHANTQRSMPSERRTPAGNATRSRYKHISEPPPLL